MKLILQRARYASVTVKDKKIDSIEKGLLIFFGVSHNDTRQITERMTDKIVKLRIFEDADGKTNRSIEDVDGEVLIVSQFTLYADCKKGNRPSFTNAMKADEAEQIYEYMLECMRLRLGEDKVKHGKFGVDMKVELLNDGPFTVILDSDEIF